MQRKKNTIRSTNTAVKQFSLWLKAMKPNEHRPLLEIQPTDLDSYLAGYFLGTRQSDGPDTLTGYQRGIDRFLQEVNYGHSIIRDDEFKRSRKCLAAKRSQLKKLGMGNKPNAADALTSEEEAIFVEKGIVGRNNPESLFYAVWLNNTKILGFRGGQENRQLVWGDITLKATPNGSEYLEFNERETKTRHGKIGAIRQFSPKIVPSGSCRHGPHHTLAYGSCVMLPMTSLVVTHLYSQLILSDNL
ncbi:uncharacterized protein KIAA1958-like [Ptychodera flava]|uniref:uncharacterized protein KIAA1958-like n=1 Tax=Ptychodera flava TaxID=63121 RepID=UPI00396A9593